MATNTKRDPYVYTVDGVRVHMDIVHHKMVNYIRSYLAFDELYMKLTKTHNKWECFVYAQLSLVISEKGFPTFKFPFEKLEKLDMVEDWNVTPNDGTIRIDIDINKLVRKYCELVGIIL